MNAANPPLFLARNFFHWWIGELLGLLPSEFPGLPSAAKRLVVRMTGDVAYFGLEGSHGSAPLGSVRLSDTAGSSSSVREILSRRGLARRTARGDLETRVRLPAESALRTTVELPAVAADNLTEVITFELDRHTPFRSGQAFIAARLLNVDRAAGTLSAEVTVVPRQVVEEALSRVTGLGLRIDNVDVAASAASGAASPALFLDDVLVRRSGGSSAISWALAAIILILAGVATTVPLVRAQQDAAALGARFAVVKDQAVARAAAQRTLEAVTADENFLIIKKRASPTVSQLLLEMTRILPDDTSLNELRVTGPEVQIAGLSASSSSLISLLERSRVFRDTSFRSPVTQDLRSGRERFAIGTRIVAPRQ